MATEEGNGKLRISSPNEGGGRLGRLLLTVVIILIIVLVTGVLAVRTEGGRDYVRHRLVRRLGVEVSVGRVGIALPYDLVVSDLQSAGYGEAGPGLRCREVRLGIGGRKLWRVQLTGPELQLARDADGRWQPASFSRLGDLASSNIIEVSRLTARMRDRMTLTLREGSIRWLDEAGTPRAAASGIAFRLTPVNIPEQRLYHYHLSVQSLTDGAGVRMHDTQREWLASETVEYLELSASRPEAGEPVQAFWEVGQ